MTTAIIWQDLASYTTRVAVDLGIPCEEFEFRGHTALLPRNIKLFRRTPVLLVAKDVLRQLPIATDWDGVCSAAAANDALRHKLNTYVSELWAVKTKRDKAKLRTQLLQNKEALLALIEALKSYPGDPYDSAMDPQGELAWHSFVNSADDSETSLLTSFSGRPLSLEDVKAVAGFVVARYKDLIENHGLARELWSSGRLRPSKSAQRIFFALADSFCQASQLEVSVECDSGTGPVEFVSLANGSKRVFVHLAVSASSHVVAGYRRHLSDIAVKEDTAGFYVVVDVGEMGSKDVEITQLRNSAIADDQPPSEIVFVDGIVKAEPSPDRTENSMANPKKIFVIHGRDDVLRRDMFTFLRALKLEPIEWSEAKVLTKKGTPYIGEVLDAAFREAQAVVAIFSGDDEAKLRDELLAKGEKSEVPARQPRPNVIFEAGMAVGRDPDRIVIVEVGRLRGLSDLHGKHTIRLDNTSERRKDLAQALATCGAAVDTNGNDWLTVGDFERP